MGFDNNKRLENGFEVFLKFRPWSQIFFEIFWQAQAWNQAVLYFNKVIFLQNYGKFTSLNDQYFPYSFQTSWPIMKLNLHCVWQIALFKKYVMCSSFESPNHAPPPSHLSLPTTCIAREHNRTKPRIILTYEGDYSRDTGRTKLTKKMLHKSIQRNKL